MWAQEPAQICAAVDSSILETAPDDPRGAIVLETEMDRAASPDGEDWGHHDPGRRSGTGSGMKTFLPVLRVLLLCGIFLRS